MVMLKPLSLAIADRDHVYGVIKSSVVNHGGKGQGFAVPNPNAQAELVTQAFEKARIDPDTINYIEVAANGSAIGDSIEIAGLSQAFGRHTSEKQFCALGSVKSNIGHLESACGIAQLTKVLLQMQHQVLVPSLHTEPLNPNLSLEDTPFYVQKEKSKWLRRRKKKRAFGERNLTVRQ